MDDKQHIWLIAETDAVNVDFLCRSGKIVPIAQRCILDYDVYGDVTGCRDLSHLDDCGIFLSSENMYIYKKNTVIAIWN